MTDTDLPELLDLLGERTPVGPPPTAEMLVAASRARRRRTTWLAAGTAAAVAVTIGGVVLFGTGSDPDGHGPADPSPTEAVTPPGTRLVGIGHAAVAVPEEWGTNETYCGTPIEDTVVIDVGFVEACYRPRPNGVESIDVHPGWAGQFGQRGEVETESFEIDGEPAERVATVCYHEQDDAALCRGAVHVPGQGVTFVAESSSASPRAKVDEILSWIRMVPGRVAVPGFQEANISWYHQDISSAEHYRSALEALGLEVEVVSREPRWGESIHEGRILSVRPRPGTMVAPGSVVRVTESAGLS